MQERNRKTKNKETKGCLLNSILLPVFRNLWVTKNCRAWVLEISKIFAIRSFQSKDWRPLSSFFESSSLSLSCFLVGPSSFCPILQGQVSGTFHSASRLMHSVPGTLLSAATWLWPKQTQSMLACSLYSIVVQKDIHKHNEHKGQNKVHWGDERKKHTAAADLSSHFQPSNRFQSSDSHVLVTFWYIYLKIPWAPRQPVYQGCIIFYPVSCFPWWNHLSRSQLRHQMSVSTPLCTSISQQLPHALQTLHFSIPAAIAWSRHGCLNNWILCQKSYLYSLHQHPNPILYTIAAVI